MSTYRITVVNHEFSACTFSDFAGPDEARREALKGALQIATDEVINGKAFFGAEICIDDEKRTIERLVLTVGQSPLRA